MRSLAGKTPTRNRLLLLLLPLYLSKVIMYSTKAICIPRGNKYVVLLRLHCHIICRVLIP